MLASLVGNMYTHSLYAALVSLLAKYFSMYEFTAYFILVNQYLLNKFAQHEN